MGMRRKNTFYVLPEMLNHIIIMLNSDNEESGNISTIGASLFGEYTSTFYSNRSSMMVL